MKVSAKDEHSILLITQYFQTLKDPRIDRTKDHPLLNILVIALTGTVCGARGWDALEAFGHAKAGWFATFLDLSHGVPSADTIRRVFERLDPRSFQRCFEAWVHGLAKALPGEVVAIDGKAVRGAFDHVARTIPLHLVHVWATEQRLLLGVRAVDGAPGEIAAAADLLRLMDLRGATVTGDANVCTTGVAQAAIDAGGDWLLHLKGNRGSLYDHVTRFFADAHAADFEGILATHHRTTTEAHGRFEVRHVWAIGHDAWPVAANTWPGMRSMVHVQSARTTEGATATEDHYYVTSLEPKARILAARIRSHWRVENDLHWSLDVCLGEDSCRIRDLRAAENMAYLRRLAFIVLRRETTQKVGVPIKQQRAGWDNDYLLKVLKCGITGS